MEYGRRERRKPLHESREGRGTSEVKIGEEERGLFFTGIYSSDFNLPRFNFIFLVCVEADDVKRSTKLPDGEPD